MNRVVYSIGCKDASGQPDIAHKRLFLEGHLTEIRLLFAQHIPFISFFISRKIDQAAAARFEFFFKFKPPAKFEFFFFLGGGVGPPRKFLANTDWLAS